MFNAGVLSSSLSINPRSWQEVALKVVPGEPLDYYWEGHGLRLHIPANALHTNIPSLTMRIQASLSGQFRLPDDMELVSGVYWISFPAKSLVQPVTLELQHCACLEQNEQTRLTFVTSKCNQETLPYQFEPLPGGVFTTSSDYGAVQVNHFSGVAVSRKKRRRTQSHSQKREGDTDGKTAEQSVAKKYLALTYYKRARSVRPTWEMHFTVIPNLDLRMKVCVLNIRYLALHLPFCRLGTYLNHWFAFILADIGKILSKRRGGIKFTQDSCLRWGESYSGHSWGWEISAQWVVYCTHGISC